MDIPSVNSFFGRHEFIIRRLHSLTGLFFVSGYLCFHLFTNAAVLDGADTYQRRADQIHAVGPTTLFFLEWWLVLLPILFHGLIGMVIVLRGKRNVWNYPYSGNIRYTLQRVTGVRRLRVHLVARLPNARLVPDRVVDEPRHQAVGRRPVRSAQRRGHGGRGHPGVGAGRRRLRRRRVGQRLPPGQRRLDDGRHLGRVDQRRRAARGPTSPAPSSASSSWWSASAPWWECSAFPSPVHPHRRQASPPRRPAPPCSSFVKECKPWQIPA